MLCHFVLLVFLYQSSLCQNDLNLALITKNQMPLKQFAQRAILFSFCYITQN